MWYSPHTSTHTKPNHSDDNGINNSAVNPFRNSEYSTMYSKHTCVPHKLSKWSRWITKLAFGGKEYHIHSSMEIDWMNWFRFHSFGVWIFVRLCHPPWISSIETVPLYKYIDGWDAMRHNNCYLWKFRTISVRIECTQTKFGRSAHRIEIVIWDWKIVALFIRSLTHTHTCAHVYTCTRNQEASTKAEERILSG